MNKPEAKPKAAIKTSIGLRNKMRKLYAQHKDYKKVMEETGCTYFQVYNAINFRVKSKPTPRADKGKSRKGNNQTIIPNKTADEFNSLEEYLEYQLIFCANEISNSKVDISTKVKLFNDVTKIQRNIQAQKIESWIKRPEAILIIRIMKRLNPKLGEEDIQKIYREEYEKVQRDLA